MNIEVVCWAECACMDACMNFRMNKENGPVDKRIHAMIIPRLTGWARPLDWIARRTGSGILCYIAVACWLRVGKGALRYVCTARNSGRYEQV